jgi:hypothetical protein
MPTQPATEEFSTIQFTKEELIEAPIDVVFQAVLDECGPECQLPDGKMMPMKLEAFPGGRWIRDLGNNTGHFWGTVQVIKPPTLLELNGPMFMSFPSSNHLQYKLVADGKQTRLKMTHQAMGLIPKQYRENMDQGWNHWIGRIKELSLRSTKR